MIAFFKRKKPMPEAPAADDPDRIPRFLEAFAHLMQEHGVPAVCATLAVNEQGNTEFKMTGDQAMVQVLTKMIDKPAIIVAKDLRRKGRL